MIEIGLPMSSIAMACWFQEPVVSTAIGMKKMCVAVRSAYYYYYYYYYVLLLLADRTDK